jgi:putative inorganic carbon (HCO3(-)) transporter
MGDVLAGVGLFAAVLSVAAAMLWQPSARRSAAMLVALALIPALILGDQWHSAEVTDLRDHLGRLLALGALAVLVVAGLTVLFRHRPLLVPLAIIAAAPFRTPIHAGGQEANLLVPLYLVIAGGVLATIWREQLEHRAATSAGGAGGGDPDRAAARGETSAGVTGPAALRTVLAGVLVLYAVQSVYSEDFSRALQNAAFFYVPFAIAFVLLAQCRWDRRLLVLALAVVGTESLVFVAFGSWEYAARHLVWNDEVIKSNDFHTYFRVNSLFWDPNVYGRYLALAIAAIVAALLWARSIRLALWLGALVGVLWLGLVSTFSQSSFVALLVGLAVLAALRWSLRWALAACAGAVIAAAAFVLVAGGSLKIDLSTQQKLNKDTSGRANLVSEGIALFGDRPLWGYGSGSFSVAYQKHRSQSGQLNVSHTEPVTVAAEQGLIGIAAYLALLVVAFATLLRGMPALMPGLRGPPAASDPAAEPLVHRAGRAAILACFVALVAHTMAYAGFLEDPLTWVLMAIGGSLAIAPEAAAAAAAARVAAEGATPPPARAPA